MTMRRLAVVAPVLVLLLFVLVVAFGLRRPDDRTVRSAMVGQPVPTFDLPGLDPLHPGLSSQDLKQGGVTLVNLFGSWCLPCAVEAPRLKALADRGVVVHAIAIRDTPTDLKAFLKRHGDPFRRIGLDPEARAQIAFGASGVPETFVIDGQGIIRYQHIGEIRPENVPELLAQVAEAKR
jgi:cytochrome c biogenesis protein CcmG/thiol:disulfide interchange protein DsbE